MQDEPTSRDDARDTSPECARDDCHRCRGTVEIPGQALGRACFHFCHQADDRAIDLAKEDLYGPGTFGEVGSAETGALVALALLVLVMFLTIIVVAAVVGGPGGPA
jgi:hypothetical protein